MHQITHPTMKNVRIHQLVMASALITSTISGFAAEESDEPYSAGLANALVKKGAVPEQCRFGPTIDLVLSSDSKGTNYVLDLDTQRLITPAHDMELQRLWKSGRFSFQESALAWRAYLRGIGADIVNEENLTGLRMYFLKLEPLKDETQWDSISAAECAHRIEELREESHPLKNSTIVCRKLPSTWVFQTREGKLGIFQICEIKREPKQVRIRHKLITMTTGD
jgi:hypothetical protein